MTALLELAVFTIAAVVLVALGVCLLAWVLAKVHP